MNRKRFICIRNARAVGIAPIAIMMIGLFVFSSCGKKTSSKALETENQMEPVATVGNYKITAQELKDEGQRRAIKGMPPLDKNELLDAMIERLAVLNQAIESKIGESPEVRRELDNLLVSKYVAREQEGRIQAASVNDQECREYYDENLSDFTSKSMYRLSILKLSPGKLASETKVEEVRSRMQAARKMAMENPAPGGRGPASRGFGSLSIRFSEDQGSRYKGGDLGWRVVGAKDPVWPEKLLLEAQKMKKGEVSKIIEDQNGSLYLVMKTDERPEKIKPFEEVRALIRSKMIRLKREEIRSSFVQKTITAAGVSINKKILDGIVIPSVNNNNQKPKLPSISLKPGN